jgi:hypothetical protein
VTTGAFNELPLLVTPYHRFTGEKQAGALSNHRFAAGCRTHERQFHGGMSLVTSIREMMKQGIGTSYSADSELSVRGRFIPYRQLPDATMAVRPTTRRTNDGNATTHLVIHAGATRSTQPLTGARLFKRAERQPRWTASRWTLLSCHPEKLRVVPASFPPKGTRKLNGRCVAASRRTAAKYTSKTAVERLPLRFARPGEMSTSSRRSPWNVFMTAKISLNTFAT